MLESREQRRLVQKRPTEEWLVLENGTEGGCARMITDP
jgi:hypothetical protein